MPFVYRRLGQAGVTLLALSIAVFLSVRLTGDPAVTLLGMNATEQDYQELRTKLGLDQPLVVQYGLFLGGIFRGDLGDSLISQQPVRDLIAQRLPATLQLAGTAFMLEVLVGVLLGVVSARARDSWLDRITLGFAVLGMGIPNFWIGIMLIFLFGASLRWLPAFGSGDFAHLVLPALTLAWSGTGAMVRLVRSSMLEVLDSEYIKFARIKGLAERSVIYKHALKNALIPALTFGGITLASLLNGSVAVEVVFSWPGMGRLMYQGIGQRDFAIVQATVLIAGLFYVASALIVDVLYAYADPRIRYD